MILAACSGGGQDPDGGAVKPDSLTPASACRVLHVTPATGVTTAFVNPLITLTYSAATAGACDDFKLIAPTLSEVPVRIVSKSERLMPQGGFAGHLSMTPREDLSPDQMYLLQQGGKRIGMFGIGKERRGSLVGTESVPVGLETIHADTTWSRQMIDDVVPALVREATRNKPFEREALLALARAELPSLSKPEARYGASALKLRYRSADASGRPVTLSGLLLVPTADPDGPRPRYDGMPMVVGLRGAAANDASDAPSKGRNVLSIPGLIAAGKGNVFLAPDLIGLGDSAVLPQAYLVGEPTAAQTHDMLSAAREYMKQRTAFLPGPEVRVTGGSLGAYGAMAALPHLSPGIRVSGVSVGGGPYDPYRTFDSAMRVLAGQPRDDYSEFMNLALIPAHLRRVMDAYRDYQGFTYKPEEVFGPDGNVLPAFVKSYLAGKQSDLVTLLNVNSLPGGSLRYDLPLANVAVYHSRNDALIPKGNSVDLLKWINESGQKVASSGWGRCHENSELVKLLLHLVKDPEASHVICFPYQYEDFVRGLPVTPSME